MLPETQKERLQRLTQQLKDAIATNNLSALQKLSEDGKRELENLPDAVKLVVFLKDAIARAHQLAPTQARVMEGKFWQMINASKRQDGYEAERLFRELLEDIRPYLDQEIPTASIATGLRR